MNGPETQRWQELFNAVLDATATESDWDELNRILSEHAEAREMYARYVNLHCTLRLMSGAFVPQETAEIAKPRFHPSGPALRRWKAFVSAAILASLAAAVLLFVWVARRSEPVVPDLARRDQPSERIDPSLRVVSLQGKLEVIGEDKVARAVHIGDEVPVGSTVRSGDEGTKAVVQISGERFHLGADTTIRLVKNDSEWPQIFVAHGDVRFEAAANAPTKPILVVTPHVEMRGDRGTADVAVGNKATRVAASEGTVQLVRRSDHKRLDVEEGTWVFAGDGSDPMVPQRPERQSAEIVLKVRVDRVALAADGATLALYTGEKIEIWDLPTRTHIRTLDPNRKRVTGLGFSPDAKWLVVGDRMPFVQIWDWRSERLVRELESPQADELAYRPVFSHDGSKLYCMARANYFMGVQGWSTADWKRLPVPSAKGRVKSFLPIPSTDAFAAGAGDGGVVLWNPISEKQVDLLRFGKAAVQGLAASSDGRWLAQTGTEGTVLWDLSKRSVRWNFEGSGYLAFNSDGTMLAIASAGYLDFWNTTTGNLVSTIRTENDQMQWLHFDVDGQSIYALSGAKHRIVAWKVPATSTY